MHLSFLENVGGYFFYMGNTLNWVVLGVFHGDLDLLISMKNLSNYPIKSFARLKKNHPHFQKERCIKS